MRTAVAATTSFCEGSPDLPQAVRASAAASRGSNRVFFMGEWVLGGVSGVFVVAQGQLKQRLGLLAQQHHRLDVSASEP
jgi:hypothetical protein